MIQFLEMHWNLIPQPLAYCPSPRDVWLFLGSQEIPTSASVMCGFKVNLSYRRHKGSAVVLAAKQGNHFLK